MFLLWNHFRCFGMFWVLHALYRRVRRPRRTAFQRISPDYSPWHTLSLMYSVAVKFALRFTNGAPSRRTLPDSVSLYLSVSIFAGMYRIGKLLSTASYPLTNPDLTAIILKLIHKCHEKEEYFSFARLERVRSVQASTSAAGSRPGAGRVQQPCPSRRVKPPRCSSN